MALSAQTDPHGRLANRQRIQVIDQDTTTTIALADRPDHLRVLVADEREERRAVVALAVVALGHVVIAREIDLEDVAALTDRERPDVALVGLGESTEPAVGLIETIVRDAACPVIAVLHGRDPAFVREVSKRGVFDHISDIEVDGWQGSIDAVLRRFAQYNELAAAFGRRALTERAKGILMERHSIDDAAAYDLLRERSRIDNQELIDVVGAVVDGDRLRLKQPDAIVDP
jgi:AmiR/NasT family two-component response regulator